MSHLILLRHAESMWNHQNRFTGWIDVPLSVHGIEQAKQAGSQLASYNIQRIFLSNLVRAQQTALIAMAHHPSQHTPVIQHTAEQQSHFYHHQADQDTLIPTTINSALNERCYGSLQGINKDQARQTFGDEQVQYWRRSVEGIPPNGESLAITAQRVLPYFKQHILPHCENQKICLICAHGNSLRALIMHLEGLTPKNIKDIEIKMATPRVYRFEHNQFTHIPNTH
jgi:2,3-bisphosphoglycerate-dependent phosphoglycerate mutase